VKLTQIWNSGPINPIDENTLKISN